MKSFLLLATILLVVFLPVRGDAGRDTVADLQAAASRSATLSLDTQSALEDIQSVVNQLKSDNTYASSFLSAVTTANRTQILTLLKQRATRTSISIRELTGTAEAYKFVGSFGTRGGKTFVLCISRNGLCEGKRVKVSCTAGCQ